MEGAGIAHASFVNDTPFLIIRTMSDSADEGADDSYDNFIDVAAHQSAAIVLNSTLHFGAAGGKAFPQALLYSVIRYISVAAYNLSDVAAHQSAAIVLKMLELAE